MPKRFFFILLFAFNISTFGSIHEELKLQVSLEQLDVKITKSFSIRAKSINQVTVSLAKGVSLEDVYLELSNGIFHKLDITKLKGQQKAQWSLKKKHIKTITFTARTNSIDQNQIEFALKK